MSHLRFPPSPLHSSWWLMRCIRKTSPHRGHRPSDGLRRPTVQTNQRITAALVDEMEHYKAFAPLHTPSQSSSCGRLCACSLVFQTSFALTLGFIATCPKSSPACQFRKSMPHWRAPLRRTWPFLRIHRLSACPGRAAQAHRRASWKWRLRRGHPQWTGPEYLHGPYASWGRHQRLTHRRYRSRRPPVYPPQDCPVNHKCRRSSRPLGSVVSKKADSSA